MLEWIIGRVEETAGAVDTPIGLQPREQDLDLRGLDLDDEARDLLFGFDREGWQAEFSSIGGYLDDYGPRMPVALKTEQERIASMLDQDCGT